MSIMLRNANFGTLRTRISVSGACAKDVAALLSVEHQEDHVDAMDGSISTEAIKEGV